MKCPFCSAVDTQVIDSRVSEEGDSIRRRRRCQVCNKRFTTYETAELRMPQIVKNDGVREDFSTTKLRTGFQRALHKRPVTAEAVDGAITRIEQKMLALEGVFIQIGLVPNTDWLKGTVELSKHGEIIVDAKGQTSVPGVFAAGDVTTVPFKQIIIAAGEGAKAALSAFDYLIRSPIAAQ